MEGGSDARFFDSVLKRLFRRKYERVVIRTWASMKRVKFSALLEAIKAMSADYIVVADYDHSPCVTSKKEWVCHIVKGAQPQRVRVVVEEIESWYAAGIDPDGAAKTGMPSLPCTDGLTKEDFNEMLPERFDSRIDFMIEILKVFSLDAARRKNRSLEYFLNKEGLVNAKEIFAGGGKEEGAKGERLKAKGMP